MGSTDRISVRFRPEAVTQRRGDYLKNHELFSLIFTAIQGIDRGLPSECASQEADIERRFLECKCWSGIAVCGSIGAAGLPFR